MHPRTHRLALASDRCSHNTPDYFPAVSDVQSKRRQRPVAPALYIPKELLERIGSDKEEAEGGERAQITNLNFRDESLERITEERSMDNSRTRGATPKTNYGRSFSSSSFQSTGSMSSVSDDDQDVGSRGVTPAMRDDAMAR